MHPPRLPPPAEPAGREVTLAVYQQVLDLGDAGIKKLERLLGACLDEVGQILCGRQPEAEWSPSGHPGLKRT